ncbi:MAG: antirestriction protein ArdA [Pseudonocardiaceae bacterium]
MNAEDAQSFIEFEESITGHTDQLSIREEAPPWPTHDTDESAERVKQCEPRIYVADTTSAQRGISHGLWIDADQEPNELDDDVAAMLASSPTPDATEWAVQATEDFAGLDLHDYTDTTLISLLAKGVAEHGFAYSAWVAINGTDDRVVLERFNDFYVGSYENAEAWMREVADDLGWQKQRGRIMDPLLQPYVTLDYAAMAEDAARSWDTVTGIDGRLYVFMR